MFDKRIIDLTTLNFASAEATTATTASTAQDQTYVSNIIMKTVLYNK